MYNMSFQYNFLFLYLYILFRQACFEINGRDLLKSLNNINQFYVNFNSATALYFQKTTDQVRAQSTSEGTNSNLNCSCFGSLA